MVLGGIERENAAISSAAPNIARTIAGDPLLMEWMNCTQPVHDLLEAGVTLCLVLGTIFTGWELRRQIQASH